MRRLALALLLCAACWAQTPQTGGVGPTIEVWYRYTTTAIANGVNGCANANGCWQVNGVLGAIKTAGLTQAVTLFQLPANGYISHYRVKTATACTGPTTLTATLGSTGSTTLFSTALYDLKAAVSATNFTNVAPLVTGSDTAAATNVVAGLIATVANVDGIAAGCSWDTWIKWAVLP